MRVNAFVYLGSVHRSLFVNIKRYSPVIAMTVDSRDPGS